ncbi:Rv1733c family protein [Streptomyces sp. YJ-C3]
MRAITGLWRWRRNPLRRRTDLAEAWVALVALMLIVVAAPVVGVVAGSLSRDALYRSVQEQRSLRHQVTATVVQKVAQPPLDSDPETSTARDAHSRVIATWKAPDGTAHRDRVIAALNTPHTGDTFPLWIDGRGQVVGRPLDRTTATTHAVLAGFGAAVAVTGLVEGTRRLVVWRMVRRRYARWDQAWDIAGPDWGRTGTGS